MLKMLVGSKKSLTFVLGDEPEDLIEDVAARIAVAILEEEEEEEEEKGNVTTWMKIATEIEIMGGICRYCISKFGNSKTWMKIDIQR